MRKRDEGNGGPSRDKTVFGISAFHHDAALTVVRGDEILFAAHSERFSRVKNDPELAQDLVDAAVDVAGLPDEVVFYERPWLSRLRMLLARQVAAAFSRKTVGARLRLLRGLEHASLHYVGHHQSHAAAGFYTAPVKDAAIVVADAFGELDCLTVWHGRAGRMRRIAGAHYPHSLGLFYAAITDRVGLQANDQEFVLMALAAFGKPRHAAQIEHELFLGRWPGLRLSRNLHRGLQGWRPEFDNIADLAASAQRVTESHLVEVVQWALRTTGTRNLVLCGGVALNCVANSRIVRESGAERIWIMPNPGDAGCSLGAALARTQRPARWVSPFLGRDVGQQTDVPGIVAALVAGRIVGLAQGRAEFGPRALGGRSLLADPRDRSAKERVNAIKRREPFRPFAPAVLADQAARYFELPTPHVPYMQYAVRCLLPEEVPAVVHVDGTSRVQTVSEAENRIFHSVLCGFFAHTGMPMLLNTSLNVKGQPMVDTREHAQDFERCTGVPVF